MEATAWPTYPALAKLIPPESPPSGYRLAPPQTIHRWVSKQSTDTEEEASGKGVGPSDLRQGAGTGLGAIATAPGNGRYVTRLFADTGASAPQRRLNEAGTGSRLRDPISKVAHL
ncbi:hypothetical protein SKAU_G00304330 [Synaphobranchus kaupii]|uniref:Uncharacterized protein n=1 Tax=Synaphobranchus kaupii TaxID=118154 RepID=A0A9Q1ILG3_SYNKA|nr:hypothetical protein SKAU_G00304330 [Synaphobranchus kaupii]